MPTKINPTPEQRNATIRRNRVADITAEGGFNPDNLAVILASYFSRHMDRPEDDKDDPELNWGPWVMKKTDEALDRIAAAFDARERPLNENIVKLRTALNHIAHPATYGTEGQDPKQIAASALRLG